MSRNTDTMHRWWADRVVGYLSTSTRNTSLFTESVDGATVSEPILVGLTCTVVAIVSLLLARHKISHLRRKKRISKAIVSSLEQSPAPRVCPPCEKVIMQAELTNLRNGHENDGYLSRKAAFSPLNAPAKRLPNSHAAWDDIASALPSLIQAQKLRTTVDRMPLLSADTSSDLADQYLLRAAAVLGITAHAYVRLEGNAPLTTKYDSHSELLPPNLYIPWTQVCKRLGRPDACLSYIDLVISNFQTSSVSHETVTLENSSLLVPTVDNQEERVFYGVMIEINAQVIPIIRHVIEAQGAVVCDDPAMLETALTAIEPLLQKITTTLHKISPNRLSKSYVDPTVWTRTVASLAVPWLRVTGAAGTAHPFFHMMDEFTGRSKYNTKIGLEARHIRASFPPHWQNFLHAIGEVSVKDYIVTLQRHASNQKAATKLSNTWTALEQSYSSDQGLLGIHKRKVFGFLSVAFRVGRDSTINGLGRIRQNEGWREASDELELSRVERGEQQQQQDESPVTPTSPYAPSQQDNTRPFHASDLIQHTSDTKGYWFTINRTIYDATNYMRSHPGGAAIIALRSGHEIHSDLDAVGHLSNPRILALLNKHKKGTLAPLAFSQPAITYFYESMVTLGQLLAETETTARLVLGTKGAKLTGLDGKGEMTAQKREILKDFNTQVKGKYKEGVVAGLKRALGCWEKVDAVMKLNGHVAVVPEIDPTSTHEASCSDDDPACVLERRIERLAAMKSIVVSVLQIIEGNQDESGKWEQSVYDNVVEKMEAMAGLAVLL